MKHLNYFNSHSEYTDPTIRPNVSYCKQEDEVHYNPIPDYSKEYLTFNALEDSTFKLSINDVNYSLDGGSTWVLLTANTDSPTVTAGNKIIWKGELVPNSTNGIGTFSSSGRFNIKGNPMSLLYDDDFIGKTSLTEANSFKKLFENNTNLINANELSLPAITLANDCYMYMFSGCTNLISAPALPAITLTDACYMAMFNGCTSLTTAPELPATTLANQCYRNMFVGCTSLTTAPKLSATTLVYGCYSYMFLNCTSLTVAPELPATTLAYNCYTYMFQGCTNLNYIKAMFTTTPSTTYTSNWVTGVASSGTFVKNAAATWDVNGVNGIPTGWTVETVNN